MAMEMQLTNQMRMAQQMKLTPAMMQSMEILQLPLAALEQRIETELNTNPVLEYDQLDSDDVDSQDEPADDDGIYEKELDLSEEGTLDSYERLSSLGEEYQDYFDRPNTRSRADSSEKDPKIQALENTPDERASMPDYLREQLLFFDTGDKISQAADLIIDNINDKGYLAVSLEQLVHSVEDQSLELADFEAALELIHKLEPPGIGARDLKECILIQLERDPDAPPLAQVIVEGHFDVLLANHLPKLANKLDCSLDDINEVLRFLSRLDTSPGSYFYSGLENAAIMVDVIIEPAEDGFYDVRLAKSSLPSLRINSEYAQMAADEKTDTQTKKYLRENILSARNLINAINQRNQTLLKVAATIVSKQMEFFEQGRLSLKPLPMQEVADILGINITTVSRAVADKYAQTPQGQMPLRDFFSTRASDSGGNVGTGAAQEMLIQIVAAEDKAKPYNDTELAEQLALKGCNVSRRTVVKYRQQLSIPPGRLRKRY